MINQASPNKRKAVDSAHDSSNVEENKANASVKYVATEEKSIEKNIRELGEVPLGEVIDDRLKKAATIANMLGVKLTLNDLLNEKWLMNTLRSAWAVEIVRLVKDKVKIEVEKRMPEEENNLRKNKDTFNKSLEDVFAQLRQIKLQIDATQKEAEKIAPLVEFMSKEPEVEDKLNSIIATKIRSMFQIKLAEEMRKFKNQVVAKALSREMNNEIDTFNKVLEGFDYRLNLIRNDVENVVESVDQLLTQKDDEKESDFLNSSYSMSNRDSYSCDDDDDDEKSSSESNSKDDKSNGELESEYKKITQRKIYYFMKTLALTF
jgi:hypothetical protein